MLEKKTNAVLRHAQKPLQNAQRGVVLLISLIILVALSIGGVALMRSVDTTLLITGNLAFQQAATRSGEAGVEDAIRTVLQTFTREQLFANDYAKGYAASTPATGSSANWWDSHWKATINPNPASMPVSTKSCADRACTLPTDAAGNTVTYKIHRLCQQAGDPSSLETGCSNRNPPSNVGSGVSSDDPKYKVETQYFYRITSRVVGPRNTVSYVQTIVAR